MSETLTLSLFRPLIPGGISYGTVLAVEFQPDSIWYETSLSITAEALKNEVRTDYHTYAQVPNKVREALARFGLDVPKLEAQETFRMIDTYTVTTGLGAPEKFRDGRLPFQAESVKVSDWSIVNVREIRGNVRETDKRRLHIDDNTSILNDYNEEKTLLQVWRTRAIPWDRSLGLVALHAFLTGVHSDAFYKQIESMHDGIIDFKTEEKGGEIEHYLRVRVIRGKTHDSRWHRIQLLETGSVKLADQFHK